MRKRTTLAVAVGALAVVGLPCGLASAHNAACVVLADGTVINVGSNREAPIVGRGAPQLPNGQLDLIPGPGDQYGARFAANQSPALIPPGGDCTT
jgi:hypothetical protein